MAETADQVSRLLEPEAQVTIAIFGGLRLWRNGHEVEIGSQRQRIVLAELICAGGNVVSISALVDALWDQDPPASAINQLHRIVGQLRRTLEPGLSPHSAGTTILASGTGYRIAASRVQCDLYQLRELTRKAKSLALGGDQESAIGCYADALELARGALFGGLSSRVETRPEFLAVEQERIATAITAADLALDQGGAPPEILAGVTAIVATDPLNEPLYARLIRLLDASGRRADALTTFEALRRRLADELGVDPGRELADAYSAVLAADAEASRPGPAAGGPPKPAQLPRALPGFVHRADAEAVLAEDFAEVGGTFVITAFGGMGGIGKTALAVQWAHRVAEHFPDGQLYVNLRGFESDGKVLDPSDAINSLLEGIGQPLASLTGLDLETRAARYRSAMTGRRMIVLLDNARDADQARPLLPGSATCLVLVTSRSSLASLIAREGARYVPLGRLSALEAHQLLVNRLGAPRVDAAPAATSAIIEGCAGLPLALSIVAARLAINPNLPLEAVLPHLADGESALDSLSMGRGRDDVRSVFSWSYDSLSSDAARVFRMVSAHPSSEFSLEAVASLAGVGLSRARKIVNELATAHMLTESTATRFTMHDLLRAYAVELLDSSREGAGAERRLVDHYLLANRAAYLTYGRPAIADLEPMAPDMCEETSFTIDDAVRWYVRERSSLEAVVDIALRNNRVRSAALLVLDRRPMNYALDNKLDSLPQCEAVLRAAVDFLSPSAADQLLLAELHRDVGARYGFLHENHPDLPKSEGHYKRALAIFQQFGDIGGEANVYRNMAITASTHDDHVAALTYAREGLRLANHSGTLYLISLAKLFVLESLANLELYQETIDAAIELLAEVRSQGLIYLEPPAGLRLAEALLNTGRPNRALESIRQVLAILSDAADPASEVGALAIAAQAAMECRLPTEAMNYARRYLAMTDGRWTVLDSLSQTDLGRLHSKVEAVIAANGSL